MWEQIELQTEHIIQLDELDLCILNHFQKTIPRPTTLEFCSYDGHDSLPASSTF